MQIPCPLMTWKLVSVFFCLGAFIAFITVIKSMDCQLSKTNPARPEGLHLKPLELGGVCKKMSTWLQRWQLSNRNFSQSCKLHVHV